MIGCVLSGGVHGVDGFCVRVETDISGGLPGIDLVGYLNSEVKEAKERVWTAIKNSGFSIPCQKVTVNLSPANIKKRGTGYDLAMAVSLLQAAEVIRPGKCENLMICGELMLSGEVGSVKGILPVVKMAKDMGIKCCIIPKVNADEGAVIDGIDIIAVNSLRETVEFINGLIHIIPQKNKTNELLRSGGELEADFKDVQGQTEAKRGLEIAAAGLHNVLMTGPPGTGKTMLSKCIPGILPPLTLNECLEVSSIYSVAGLLNKDKTIINKRPFMNPHHTVTDVTLTGGGNSSKPGIIPLSHCGVLFLDEMPEFSKKTLEVLRQPMEDKILHVARANYMCDYPSDFMLVGAMNPCPCGMYPDLSKCTCSETTRKKYISKISKPLLDRIDICLNVMRPESKDILYKKASESSFEVRKRVIKAQNIQLKRFEGMGIHFNSQMGVHEIEKFCVLNDECLKYMEKLFLKYDLSARAYHRILKTSRTIADLDDSIDIQMKHLTEAVFFRVTLE